MLTRTFGPKRDVVAGEWRKLHNEEFTTLYSPNIWAIKSRRIRWEGHVARIENINVYKGLVRRPLGRPWHRWDNNIKMDLKEVGRGHGLD